MIHDVGACHPAIAGLSEQACRPAHGGIHLIRADDREVGSGSDALRGQFFPQFKGHCAAAPYAVAEVEDISKAILDERNPRCVQIFVVLMDDEGTRDERRVERVRDAAAQRPGLHGIDEEQLDAVHVLRLS